MGDWFSSLLDALPDLGSLFGGSGDVSSAAGDPYAGLSGVGPVASGEDYGSILGTSGIGPYSSGTEYGGALNGLTLPSTTSAATIPAAVPNLQSKDSGNSLLGSFIAGASGPTIAAIGASLRAQNDPSTALAQQKLAQDQAQFEASLALQKEQAGAAKKLQKAALALQKKLARAKMIQDAYTGLATNETTGRTNNANALQRIVENIQLPTAKRYTQLGNL